MENESLKEFIRQCNDIISVHGTDNPLLYEVCFFKIYAKFEHLLSDLFEKYASGESSSLDYLPTRKLQFENREHLRAILQDNGQQYNYTRQIEYLSKHIFIENPFDIIYNDYDNNDIFNKMMALRNYIAHESPKSREWYKRCCLNSKDESRYVEPHVFLKKRRRGSHKSYYTIFVETMSDISDYLIGAIPTAHE